MSDPSLTSMSRLPASDLPGASSPALMTLVPHGHISTGMRRVATTEVTDFYITDDEMLFARRRSDGQLTHQAPLNDEDGIRKVFLYAAIDEEFEQHDDPEANCDAISETSIEIAMNLVEQVTIALHSFRAPVRN